jgi:hypothetical protein
MSCGAQGGRAMSDHPPPKRIFCQGCERLSSEDRKRLGIDRQAKTAKRRF